MLASLALIRFVRRLTRALGRNTLRHVHRFRVVPLSAFSWPSGDYRDAGTLWLTPDDIERSLAISFQRGVDDLDYYRALALLLPTGRRVVLNWYERAPEPRQLSVLADASDDLAAALVETLDALALPADLVSWRPASA